MAMFTEYRPDARGFGKAYAHIRNMGGVPMGLALALVYAHAFRPGPGVWCALGLAVGLLLVLYGAYALPGDRRRSAFGQWLYARAERWIPFVFFGTHYALFNLSLIMIWITLHDLGFQSAGWQHAVFVLLIVLLPVRRFAEEWSHTHDRVSARILFAVAHYALIMTLIAVTANVLMASIVSQSEPFQTDTDPLVLIVWVLSVTAILFCAILLTSRIRAERGARPAKPPTPPPDPRAPY